MSHPISKQSAQWRDATPSPEKLSNWPASQVAVEPKWSVRRGYSKPQIEVATRTYEVMWRARNGDIFDRRVTAPAVPVFEAAFNSFARGALIATQKGPVSVEDLLPGDLVETTNGHLQPISWIGSMTLDINGTRGAHTLPEKLYRITEEAFGFERPAPDLVLGAAAHTLYRADGIRSYLGTPVALAPIVGLVDGMSVIEVTPVTSVRTYHIALPQHAIIRVNGVEMESYHPGTTAAAHLTGDMRIRFMGLFPHLDSLGDFGAMAQSRLTASDLMMLQAV